MKRILIYWLVVLLSLLTTSVQLHAQEVSIIVDVTHPTKKVVDHDGNKCVIEGGEAIYKINVSGIDSIAEVNHCKYIYNGTKEDAKYTLNNGIISVNDIKKENLLTNKEGNTFKFEIECNKEGTKYGDACLVKVYPTPKADVTAPEKNKFQLKDSKNLRWKADCTGGGTWRYKWNCSDSKESESSDFFDSFEKAGEYTINLIATNYAPDETTIWEQLEKSWTIDVYDDVTEPKKSVEENTNDTREELFQDASWFLSFETNEAGGDPSGWSFVWKDEVGTILSEDPSCSLSCERSTDTIDKNITVEVTNKVTQNSGETDTWYIHTFNYYAKFYPCPIVEFSSVYNSELMHGEEEPMSVDIKNDEGESLLEKADWNIVWKVDGEVVTSGKSYTYNASNTDINNGKKCKVDAVVSGTLKGIKKHYEGTISHTFTVWTLPSLSYANEDDKNQYGYGGMEKIFKAVGNGGKIDGWTYDWYHNNNKIKTTDTEEFLEELVNNSDELIPDEYMVVAHNICHGKDFMLDVDNDLTYIVNIFPKPYYPSDFKIIDLDKDNEIVNRVRDGNHLRLVREECYGANPDGWNTIWKYDNDFVNNESYVIVNGNYSSMKKECSKNVKISMNIINTFEGDSWIDYNCERELSIYARPITPSSITKKGDGTSGTAIATISVSDEDLKNREYWLVFGYMNGEDFVQVAEMEQKEAGTVRWASGYNSSNIDGILAVYSEWRYDDGARVTSGLCTSVGNDEDWDNSDFSAAGSRGDDSTSISEVEIDSSNHIMQIYDQVGRRITSMRKGMSIVRMYDGTTKKVYNK